MIWICLAPVVLLAVAVTIWGIWACIWGPDDGGTT